MSHVSKFKKKDKKEEDKSQKERKNERTGEGEREEREREWKKNSLLSKIYGNRTIGFHRNKRQSRSTHRELRVGTKILEFHQTSRGREFSYLGYF